MNSQNLSSMTVKFVTKVSCCYSNCGRLGDISIDNTYTASYLW